MKYTTNYLKELTLARHNLSFSFLENKTLALSGATGLIGSYLIDVLLLDRRFKVNIIAMVRNINKAIERFSYYQNDERLQFALIDLSNPIHVEQPIDYLIHAASNTSPHEYALYPIETMLTSIIGNKNMLDLALSHQSRYMFISTTEIYGQATIDRIDESYSGYLNPLDVRSAYNEGKRAAETLTIAYAHQHNLSIVIPRLSRVYGPTRKDSDQKALSQFINKGLKKEDIILKSQGEQMFSYMYVSDAVSGLLYLLEHGKNNQAYNMTHPEAQSLKEIARIVAQLSGVSVVYDLSKEVGVSYSKAEHALLDVSKINKLGWAASVNLNDGLKRTFAVMGE